MPNPRLISQSYLDGSTKYSFCPYCVQELENEGKNYKEILKPLKFVKIGEPIKQKDGSYKEIVSSHYECLRCGNQRITEETFSTLYGDKESVLRAKGLPIEKTILRWNPSIKDYQNAKWNNETKRYDFI